MRGELNPDIDGWYRVTLSFHIKLDDKDVDHYDEWVEYSNKKWLLDELGNRCTVTKILRKEQTND